MSSPTEATADVITGIINWAKKPYQQNMNLGGWTLFVGMVIALAVAWSIILNDIKGS